MQETDIREAFTFLEPGPVTLVTASDGQHDSLMTISWTMAVDYAPNCPTAIFYGLWNHTFSVMMETGECVISVPSADMAERVVRMGTESSSDVDKFQKYALTKARGCVVAAPLVEECIASLECKVEDYFEKYGLVILCCKKLWVNPQKEFAPMLHANGDGTFRTDSDKILNHREIMQKWVPKGCERFF